MHTCSQSDDEHLPLFRGPKRLPAPGSQDRFFIFFDLIRQLKVLIVNVMIFVLTFVAAVFPADVWSRFVSHTTMGLFVQRIARQIGEEIPRIVIDKDCGSFVQQEPMHVVIFFSAFRRVNRQGKVSATFAGAVIARGLTSGDLLAVGTGQFGHNGILY